MNKVGLIAAAQLFANLGVGNLANFPSAIEVFISHAAETFLREIAKDQITFGNRPVLSQVPGLANRVIAKQVPRGTGPERNNHEIPKQCVCFRKLGIVPRQKEKTEFGEMSEKRQICMQMVSESGEVCFRALNVSESHNGRRRRRRNEHGIAIDEVPNRGPWGVSPSVGFARQI